MTTKNLPPVEYLRKRLRYEPETGKLFWLDCEEMSKSWRTRRSGKEAFTAPDGDGYRLGAIDGVLFKSHRVAYAIYHGKWPDGHIDHVNGIRSDNRIENLRDVSNQENARNQNMRRRNTSGVVGVQWDDSRKKWCAQITVSGKNIHLGRFLTFEEAVASRLAANERFGFSKRHGEKTA